MVNAFELSGLMTPEFTVAVYMGVDQVGAFKAAILQTYPKSNPQLIYHTMDDNAGWLQGNRLNAALVNIEMIFFVGARGGVDRWFFDKDGEDSLRMAGKLYNVNSKLYSNVLHSFMRMYWTHLL